MNMTGRMIGRLTVVIAAVAILLMMLHVSADVLFRVVASKSLPGTAEIVSHYYMVALSFLPIAYAELKDRHIEATVLTDLMPASAQATLKILGMLFSLGIYGLMTYVSGREAIKKTAINAVVESGTHKLLVWPSYWILPVSFALMCLALLLRIFRYRRFDPSNF